MTTEIIVTAEFEGWYENLPVTSRTAIIRVVDSLQAQGATLGFTYSSAILGSSLALRELRVQVMGEPFRILYVFDPARQAILLLGGNKVGRGNRWYKPAIRLAERLYAVYLKETGQG